MLPPEWQDKLLDRAITEGLTVRALREQVKQVRAYLAQGWTADQLEVLGLRTVRLFFCSTATRCRNVLLAVVGGPIAFLVSVPLAHELSLLRAAEIPLALEVVDARPGVDPHELVARTCHPGRRGMRGRLCAHRVAQHQHHSEAQAAGFRKPLHAFFLVHPGAAEHGRGGASSMASATRYAGCATDLDDLTAANPTDLVRPAAS